MSHSEGGSAFSSRARSHCLGVVFDPTTLDMCHLIPASVGGKTATDVTKMWWPIHHHLYKVTPQKKRLYPQYPFLSHPANGIKMESSLHRQFDRGVFALFPLETNGMMETQVVPNIGDVDFLVLENTERATRGNQLDQLLFPQDWTMAVNMTTHDNQNIARINFTKSIENNENDRTFAFIVSQDGNFTDRSLFGAGVSLRTISQNLRHFRDILEPTRNETAFRLNKKVDAGNTVPIPMTNKDILDTLERLVKRGGSIRNSLIGKLLIAIRRGVGDPDTNNTVLDMLENGADIVMTINLAITRTIHGLGAYDARDGPFGSSLSLLHLRALRCMNFPLVRNLPNPPSSADDAYEMDDEQNLDGFDV